MLANSVFSTDCKSVVSDFGGSNPPSSTKALKALENPVISRLFCCFYTLSFVAQIDIKRHRNTLKSVSKCCQNVVNFVCQLCMSKKSSLREFLRRLLLLY